MVRRRILVSIGLVGAAIALIGGCSCSFSIGGTEVDVAKLEDSIQRELVGAGGARLQSVDCSEAEGESIEEGKTVQCTGRAPNGDPVPVVVTFNDDEGESVSFEVPRSAGQGV